MNILSHKYQITINTILIVLIITSAGCTTHRAIRLKKKSLREWKPNNEKDKKTETNNLVMSYTGTFEENISFLAELDKDYDELIIFSETNSEFDISKANFKELFLEGVVRSYNFFYSSDFIDSTKISLALESKILSHPQFSDRLLSPHIIESDSISVINSFDKFSGRWYGKWEARKMKHLWLPSRKTNLLLFGHLELVGFQSCFLGDGIGWNYLVKEKNRFIIFGFVCHFDKSGVICAKNPHYAFLNYNGQLTWVSDDHIYYEFIRSEANIKHYIITGIRYRKRQKELEPISLFQAIYLSEDLDLPEFSVDSWL